MPLFFGVCYNSAIMVRLDKSLRSHRLDAEGNKQATAVDLVSGETYVKVAPYMPWKHPRSAKAGVHVAAEELAAQGAHQEHCDDEWFRGVWIPLEEAGESAEVEVDEDGNQVEEAEPQARPHSTNPKTAKAARVVSGRTRKKK
jgi:hypothetical protein